MMVFFHVTASFVTDLGFQEVRAKFSEVSGGRDAWRSFGLHEYQVKFTVLKRSVSRIIRNFGRRAT